MARLLIYGASGYTGRLIVDAARERGLRPLLAGRDAAKLATLATLLGLEWRAAPIDAPDRLGEMLRDVDVVLNAAGPFEVTAQPLVDACLRAGAHYLDVTGEIPVFEALERRSADAIAHGIMLMPGVGFVVVPSDCLAAHVAARLPRAHRLTLAFSAAGRPSRGSMKTATRLWSHVVKVRRRGIVVAVPVGSLERAVDYGDGPRVSTAVSWGDVVTAFHTTRIPNVEVYHEVRPAERALFRASSYLAPLLDVGPWRWLLERQADLLPPGPSDLERRTERRVIVAEAEDRSGNRVAARVETPEAYACTAIAAVAIAERVLDGEHATGFQTPAGVYGAALLRRLAGVLLEDLPLREAPAAGSGA